MSIFPKSYEFITNEEDYVMRLVIEVLSSEKPNKGELRWIIKNGFNLAKEVDNNEYYNIMFEYFKFSNITAYDMISFLFQKTSYTYYFLNNDNYEKYLRYFFNKLTKTETEHFIRECYNISNYITNEDLLSEIIYKHVYLYHRLKYKYKKLPKNIYDICEQLLNYVVEERKHIIEKNQTRYENLINKIRTIDDKIVKMRKTDNILKKIQNKLGITAIKIGMYNIYCLYLEYEINKMDNIVFFENYEEIKTKEYNKIAKKFFKNLRKNQLQARRIHWIL